MKYVIALGGNALGDRSSLRKVAAEVVKQYLKGNRIVLTHGNGPQVGELAQEQHRNLAVLTAETQAWIGTEIKNSINIALSKAKKDPEDIVEVVITEAEVDRNSKEFDNPTKPIGPFYTAKEAAQGKRHGLVMKKLIGGYRRVVPSPIPKKIIQMEMIKKLLKQGKIVIACGGGGMPVSYTKGKQEYVDAVIDKDRASALLAKEINADKFFILTNVDGVYLNYKKKNQKFLKKVSAKKLKQYLKDGQFEEGSMKPKVESCIDVVESTKRSAGIGSMSNPNHVFSLKKLTVIMPTTK